jgi:malate dehydrogenase (quinone)
MLGASPGASTSVAIMLEVIERCFTDQLDHSGWIDKLRKMIPSYGESLITNTDLCRKVRSETASALNIVNL